MADLRASSSGAVTLTSPTNAVQAFAAASLSSIALVDKTALTIGTVDGVNGITTTNGQIQVATKGGGAITIASPIASGGGEIDIAAAPGFGVNNTTTSITSGNGNIVLLGDSMSLSGGAGSVNAGGGTVVFRPWRPRPTISSLAPPAGPVRWGCR